MPAKWTGLSRYCHLHFLANTFRDRKSANSRDHCGKLLNRTLPVSLWNSESRRHSNHKAFRNDSLDGCLEYKKPHKIEFMERKWLKCVECIVKNEKKFHEWVKYTRRILTSMYYIYTASRKIHSTYGLRNNVSLEKLFYVFR